MPGEVQPADLESRLETVRTRGFELMPSQQTVGVQNLSAPVFGPNGTVAAALTCPYLTWTDVASSPDVAATLGLLQGAARRIAPAAGGAAEAD